MSWCDMENRALKLRKDEKMSTPKLAIVILLLAALLFMVAPNLSWVDCSRRRPGSAIAAADSTSIKRLVITARTEPAIRVFSLTEILIMVAVDELWRSQDATLRRSDQYLSLQFTTSLSP